jgi:hypothetical protein
LSDEHDFGKIGTFDALNEAAAGNSALESATPTFEGILHG